MIIVSKQMKWSPKPSRKSVVPVQMLTHVVQTLFQNVKAAFAQERLMMVLVK